MPGPKQPKNPPPAPKTRRNAPAPPPTSGADIRPFTDHAAVAFRHGAEVIRLAGIIAETATKEQRQWAQRFVEAIRELAHAG